MAVAAFAVASAGVFLVGAAVDETVGLPHRLTAGAACPVVGCASGACHDYAAVPEPDGVHGLVCPETAGCASVECHGWDALRTRYHQASDASLNLWFVIPALLAGGLVALATRRGGD